MAKLNTTPRVNVDAETARWHREIAQQVNAVSEGAISGAYNARATVPTTGTYQAGDQIRKLAPVEAGSASSKYVITGWICVAGGSPGTWLQMRVLTGN